MPKSNDGISIPAVSVVIPVYNEEKILAQTVEKVVCFLASNCSFRNELVIANNASTDKTLEIAWTLKERHPEIRVVNVDKKGRGGALKSAWGTSQAEVLAYMDADLSTDLACFCPLIDAVLVKGYDIAIGSRLLPQSGTQRSIKREAISRGYNAIIKAIFHTRFSDAQCGFKAISKRVADRLLKFAESDGWFMDTELLILAEELGFRIFEVPVNWKEGHQSHVKLWATVLEDVKGLIRLHRTLRRLRQEAAACETK